MDGQVPGHDPVPVPTPPPAEVPLWPPQTGEPRTEPHGSWSPSTAELPVAAVTGPKPLMSMPAHVLVTFLTCGLWLLAGPAVCWLRRGAVKPALIWIGAWLVLFVI